MCFVGCRDQLVEHLGELEKLSQRLDMNVPLDVFRYVAYYITVSPFVTNYCAAFLSRDIDQNKNPNMITKARIDDTAAENQWINGRLHAIEVSSKFLNANRFHLKTTSRIVICLEKLYTNTSPLYNLIFPLQ